MFFNIMLTIAILFGLLLAIAHTLEINGVDVQPPHIKNPFMRVEK